MEHRQNTDKNQEMNANGEPGLTTTAKPEQARPHALSVGERTADEASGEMLHKEFTAQIIGAAFEVYRHLGYGFLERVYQRAMKVELESRGLKTEDEHRIRVWYKGVIVGEYQADLLVNDVVVVELKVAKDYQSGDEPQLLNELKGTGTKVGLLINFGRTKVEFKRFVF